MKTLRLAIISLVAVASASASFAGPGIQYWNARRADRAVERAATPTVNTPTPEKCESMIVKQGKRTTTVKCDGAVANTAQCKAVCGS